MKGTGSDEEIVMGDTLRCLAGGEAKIFSGGASSRERSFAFFFAVPDFGGFFDLSFCFSLVESEGCAESGRGSGGEAVCVVGAKVAGAEDGPVPKPGEMWWIGSPSPMPQP